MDAQEALALGHRFEPTHLSFLFPGMLMRDFSPGVFILARSMVNGMKNLAMSGRIALEFVSDRCFEGEFRQSYARFFYRRRENARFKSLLQTLDYCPCSGWRRLCKSSSYSKLPGRAVDSN